MLKYYGSNTGVWFEIAIITFIITIIIIIIINNTNIITNHKCGGDHSIEEAFVGDQEILLATQVLHSHKQNHISCIDSWPPHCQQQHAHTNH